LKAERVYKAATVIRKVYLGWKVRCSVVGITEVTEEMVLAQVAQQLITVHVALITKAAQWMTAVRPIVCITNTTMSCKFLAIVKFAFKGKYLHTQKVYNRPFDKKYCFTFNYCKIK